MKLSDLPVLELTGTPYEQGYRHGEQMREAIDGLIGGWIRLIEKLTGESAEAAAARFASETRFLDAVRTHTPQIEDELRGLSAGSGVPFDILYMFNCTDENQWYLEEHLSARMEEGRGCSSFGRASAGEVFLGQNMDIPGSTEGYQVLLQLDDGRTRTCLFSLAGLVGMIGMSSAPLGVVNNSMKQLQHRRDGLPVNMVVRGLLQQPDMEAARDFITRVPHATGHNYIVGDASQVAMFECSANEVVELEQESCLVHTNHPLQNSDVLSSSDTGENLSSSNTHNRYAEMCRLAGTLTDVPAMKSALSSHTDEANPVCRHRHDARSSFSAGSVIYQLSGQPQFMLAPGPPCETEFGTWNL